MAPSEVACRRAALRRLVLFLAIVVLSASGLRAQDRWTSHTSLREVTDIVASDAAIWVGTTGGVFSYTFSSNEVDRYTPTEGLSEVVVEAVAFDAPRQALWVGYRSGILDRVDIASGAVTSFRDIARAERFPSRGIQRILVAGDSLFVSTDFGVVVVDPAEGRVRDSYTRFGSFTAGMPVYDVALAPTPSGAAGIWVAHEEGVAYAPVAADNLKDPGAWTTEGYAGDNPAYAISYFSGDLYVGGEGDLWRRVSNGGYQALNVTGAPVRDLHAAGDALLAAGEFSIFIVSPDGTAQDVNPAAIDRFTAVTAGPAGEIWTGTLRTGAALVTTSSEAAQEVAPEGPFSNIIRRLAIGEDGTLWAGGAGGAFSGFYAYDLDGGWTNYNRLNYDALEGRGTRYARVHAGGPAKAWAGSYGAGVVHVLPDGDLRVYDQTNSTLRAPVGEENRAYVTVRGIYSDAQDRVWVTNMGAALPLHVRLPDGEWHGLNRVGDPSATYERIFIDAFGQKWIALRDQGKFNAGKGLLVLDTRGTPADGADDLWHHFDVAGAAGTGLPGVIVNDIEEDNDGRFIWLATNEGVAYFENTGAVAMQEQPLLLWPQRADRQENVSSFLLYGLGVNDLAFDPANRIWLATGAGAYLIQETEGGYEIVEHFTNDNSPLFSDQVTAVAVAAETGEVYFATDGGLLSYRGTAIQPLEQVEPLFVYPNPARIGRGQPVDICIEGLVEATDIRVLTPAGEVVAGFEGRGGRTCWDGRDAYGRFVPSGVYVIAAVAEGGVAYGKVAVIR